MRIREIYLIHVSKENGGVNEDTTESPMNEEHEMEPSYKKFKNEDMEDLLPMSQEEGFDND